jgi:hypothetical protein
MLHCDKMVNVARLHRIGCAETREKFSVFSYIPAC